MTLQKRVPLAQHLRHEKRRRRVVWVIATAVLWVLLILDHQGLLLYRGDWTQYHGRSFRVVAVIDGDTIDIDAPDGDRLRTRVRLWGIDTPEMARPKDNRPAQPFADKATQFTRQLCLNQIVSLQLEQHRLRGRYGRLLAHVTLPDQTTLSEALLAAGLAHVDKRFTHSLEEHYRLIAQQAAFDHVGLHSKKSDQ